jgi:hypothetical protein
MQKGTQLAVHENVPFLQHFIVVLETGHPTSD